ncbi:MAG: RNA methyltransferase [Corynebacterium sp.]|nr:RNA methyltransferase [Corynebacterium sp.]
MNGSGDILTERSGRIVQAAKLKKAHGRTSTGLFLVEGANAVEAAVEKGCVRDLFVRASLVDMVVAGQDDIRGIVARARAEHLHVHAVDERAAAKLSDTVTTPGIFAVCHADQVLTDLDSALGVGPALVTIPVDTADPGNAGTLVRLSDAMGAGSVIFAGNSVDPLGGKVVRASAGSIFHLPVVRHRDTDAVLAAVRQRGMNLVATAADGEIDITDFKQAGAVLSQPTAWLLGNEAHGLGAELLAEADYRVRIPIRGQAESLNLATAAAICLYESARHLFR